MIANAVNAMLGIGLVYLAVLQPSVLAATPWILLGVGVAVIGLALVASRSDFLNWPSNTILVIGVLLIGSPLLRAQLSSWVFTFWGVFWAGLIIALMALWAALYRPSHNDGGSIEWPTQCLGENNE